MKAILASLALLSTTAFAHIKELPTKADSFATGRFSEQKHHRWPFALLSIGHNMQSYQDYGGSPYWHDGLDIRGQKGESVMAAAAGKVVNIENYVAGNPLYWEVAIMDDEGFVWKYHHIEEKSIPQTIREAYRTGARIEAGESIGDLVHWPISSFGEVYHHLHLLVVGKDGRYINPFLMMGPLPDTKAPTIKRIGIAQSHRPLEGNKVKGAHSLYLEASDLVLHEKFTLPPHKISYRLDGAEEKVVWEFVHLPSGKNDTDYISDFYLSGTCGNYTCRKFYFNLNFTPERPRSTMMLAPGAHHVEVTAEDLGGNKETKSFNWQVL